MKEVHLICNAHIDPIWQWEWEEGAASALSTFRAAADLADEFDYIFCHNEVTLYKYIEEYAPGLFARIKELIRIGKWRIIGSWYLQPDCNMPSGESFVRQILMGRKYFMEKFGCYSTTAINFDGFGHSVGLPQIVKKCGQDSYITHRGGDDPLPSNQFRWESPDGSQIKVNVAVAYNTPLGNSVNVIKERIAIQSQDVVCVLWGVGNHGGGPSRKDLGDIKAFMEESEMEILHSTPEAFFARISPEAVHRETMKISMPGCYTSMSRIKQKHAEMENTLFMTEKLCSAAALRGLIEYPTKELDEAVEDLLNCQFHDVLPGSSVRAGEENGLQLIEHGMQILNKLRARAYFALTATQKKAGEGEFPILVYNPQAYEWETDLSCEFMLADQNWSSDSYTKIRVYDENGNLLPSQTVKEESNLNLDWRKKVLFRGKCKPFDITRFSVYTEVVPKTEAPERPVNGDIIVDCGSKHVEIDGTTGLLRSYRLNGREYVKENAFRPVLCDDNPDPWAMQGFQLAELGTNPKPFTLMEHPDGPFRGLKPIQILEDGELTLNVECFFSCENSFLRLEYDISKNDPHIDVKVDAFVNDVNRFLKLEIPTVLPGTYIGQTAFAVDNLYMNGRECVAQRFTAIRENADHCLAILNRGTYGSSFRDGVISLSLLRTASYCAHPILDRPIIPTDRFVKKIDLGERNFAFRLTVAAEDELDRVAGEFNNLPYVCNVFPIERDLTPAPYALTLSDNRITLVTVKKAEDSDDYILRLHNNSPLDKDVALTFCGAAIALHFGRYEVKTVRYNGSCLEESEAIVI